MELRLLVETCELFVYLNVRFRSYQFEEVPLLQTFIKSVLEWTTSVSEGRL